MNSLARLIAKYNLSHYQSRIFPSLVVLQEAKDGHDGHVIPVQHCNNIGGDTLSSPMPL